jgi:dephospho-CoA kinase
MIVVGLTGGIATGKTTVAELLRRKGAAIIDTDELSREVTAPGAPAFDEIVQAFGPNILTDQGTLDRKRLGSLVFADPALRRRLEGITHPRIRQALRGRLAALRGVPHPPPVVIAVIPLLFETGAERDVDLTVAVVAPEAEQVRRLMARDRLGRTEAEARVRAQMPVDEKRKRADFVVEAAGSLEETAEQAQKLWGRLMERAGA